ncbi:LLM class flavin-dependent oxidoreductase, partial [Amycolatopsis sp. NPDC000673]
MSGAVGLGTAVSLVSQHHPITLAKQAASVDVLSGGR